MATALPPPPQTEMSVDSNEYRFWFFQLYQRVISNQSSSSSSSSTGGDYVVVTDFGARGNGTTDDAPAFNRALAAAAGGTVLVPTPTVAYNILSAITVPENTYLLGESKLGTVLKLGAAGNMFEFASDGCGIFNLALNGNAQVGHAVNVSGDTGQQIIENCFIYDFNSEPLYFAQTGTGADRCNAGSGFSCVSTTIYATPGSGLYAVKMYDGVQASACPRKFVNVETGGEPSFSFGGSNSTYITNCFLDNLDYSTNTRAVFIGQSRIAGSTTTDIDGGQNTIVGCDIFQKLTLVSGTSGNVIGPNAYNSAGTSDVPLTDNSGNGENLVYHYYYTYTPTFQASGGGAAIGDGTITGRWCRQGNVVFCNIQMIIGATTNLGAGIFQFTIPTEAPSSFPFPQFNSQCRGTNGGLLYFGTPVLPNGANYVELQRDTVNGFTFNTPVVWVAGDTINASFSYMV